METLSTPPRPVLTLRVGVTGHRPNKLSLAAVDQIAPEIERFLRQVAERVGHIRRENALVYASAPPKLRLISALAEGADRFVATAALREQFELLAMLPFPLELYRQDFGTEEARQEFFSLLDRAAAVVELDGRYEPAEARSPAYRSVGIAVVQHSDLIVAVWNGQIASGEGGTGEIIEYALRTDCPIVWFPSDWGAKAYYGDMARLLLPDRSVVRDVATEVLSLTKKLFAAPAVEPTAKWRHIPGLGGGAESSPVAQYLAETAPRWAAGRFFVMFRNAATTAYGWFRRLMPHEAPAPDAPAPAAGAPAPAAAKPRDPDAAAPDPAAPPFPEKPRGEGPVAASVRRWRAEVADVMNAPGFHDRGFESLAHHYAWLDHLSTHYAGLYRSAYLMNYLLAAMAIIAAATHTRPGTVVELLCVFFILLVTVLGNRRHWHRRWIEYRDIAEQLRTLRYLRLVASPPALPRLPEHLGEAAPSAAWTRSFYQAIVRECGLPAMRFRPDYLTRVRAQLVGAEIADQVRYHHDNSKMLHDFDHGLHLISVTAFLLTLPVALTHLVWNEFGLLSIILPAVGAAMFAIRNQGEFLRLSERSQRMEAALQRLGGELSQSSDAVASRESLEAKAQTLATTMLSETGDWKIVFRGRPLALPV